jgi:hypothetical protein
MRPDPISVEPDGRERNSIHSRELILAKSTPFNTTPKLRVELCEVYKIQHIIKVKSSGKAPSLERTFLEWETNHNIQQPRRCQGWGEL